MPKIFCFFNHCTGLLPASKWTEPTREIYYSHQPETKFFSHQLFGPLLFLAVSPLNKTDYSWMFGCFCRKCQDLLFHYTYILLPCIISRRVLYKSDEHCLVDKVWLKYKLKSWKIILSLQCCCWFSMWQLIKSIFLLPLYQRQSWQFGFLERGKRVKEKKSGQSPSP